MRYKSTSPAPNRGNTQPEPGIPEQLRRTCFYHSAARQALNGQLHKSLQLTRSPRLLKSNERPKRSSGRLLQNDQFNRSRYRID